MELGETTLSGDELRDLFKSQELTAPDEVIFSKEELAQSRMNQLRLKAENAGFQNAPIYRTLHHLMRLIYEISMSVPRKSIKVFDVIISNMSEMIRWTAAGYNHNDVILKINALEEALALKYVIRIMLNSMPNNLIGMPKRKQLTALLEAVKRQLVAWRGSLTK